ncbi:MAG: choice-of-anchor D domain-containing protein [Candidatus Eisenbacteria bacterium]|uniref:Choice-of-anchor D domain-containing protein n=1 Tax=Eiseniibacteriota bacterium TaxID=2212470 RepID=A0A948RZ01_UNCEI|nr:choice-of-anchor D domain-containing protein [Candidatus Eisenbacteria bacterium]MBU1948325.1 choice-of-anchor D domain-containing protein [Candidatus Eisenbacteria bacterium]MBU2692218.1 choice-of-anchor D domain-containing protein [Candidatus Eisenbacteria bacterium]
MFSMKHRNQAIRQLGILTAIIGAMVIIFVACGEDKLVSSSATGTLSVQMQFVDNPAGAGKAFGNSNIALIDSIQVLVLEEDSDEIVAQAIVPVAENQNSFRISLDVPSQKNLRIRGVAIGTPADAGCGASTSGSAYTGLSAVMSVRPRCEETVPLTMNSFIPGIHITSIQGPLVNLAWGRVPGAEEYILRTFDEQCGFTDLVQADTIAMVNLNGKLLESSNEILRVRAVNAISTGTFSAPITLNELPLCLVEPAFIDFGDVNIGELSERTFTIINDGGGLLTGSVESTCDAFEIIEGAGNFELAGAESRTVTIRYLPTAAGDQDCTILTGTGCAQVQITGSGGVPGCEISTASLDFGSIKVGETADRSFTVSNIGSGIVRGSISANCNQFAVIEGAGDYVLAAQSSRTVTVRYHPSTTGSHSCAVQTGTRCGQVSLTGHATSPRCQILPAVLNFGDVVLGASKELSFRVTNTGTGILNGEIGIDCDQFEIVSGGGAFDLESLESIRITVRYAPDELGEHTCTITTGTDCSDITVTGASRNGDCRLTASNLAFGLVNVGESKDLTFGISNPGAGNLHGKVEEACEPFAIIEGAGDFDILGAGTHTVTVRYSPTADGFQACTIQTGTSCNGVRATGTAETPVCQITPAQLDFAALNVGSMRDRSFTIKNTGGGVLKGFIESNCDQFAIVRGGGDFALESLKSRTVTVRYQPTESGEHTCTILTGTECDVIPAVGTAVRPDCLIEPSEIVFDATALGDFPEKTFILTNVGTGILSGFVEVTCDDFEIIEGGGAFNLGVNDTLTVVVRYQPMVAGEHSCSILTGTTCGMIPVSGTAQGPICQIDATEFDFGELLVGETSEQTFTLSNVGMGMLTGSIITDCDQFEIVAGSGPYDLGSLQELEVTVRYQPTEIGNHSCSISTGTECGFIYITGSANSAICDVNPSILDFDNLDVGDSNELTFTLSNIGVGTLSGVIEADCEHFEIVSGGGAFDLAGGDDVVVTVRYEPTEPGDHLCIIETGTGCTVLARAGSSQPAACIVEPSAVNFGEVTVGSTKDLSFTITNGGGGNLSGSLSLSCEPFTIISGGGAFSLGSLDSREVVVRYSPTSVGNHSCTVALNGTTCGSVALTGSGTPAPLGKVTPSVLDFGVVPLGYSSELTFTLKNIGSINLSGTVTETSPHYEIIGGKGAYELAPNAQIQVTVRFKPVAYGYQSCVVQTGRYTPNVSCFGTGEADADCFLNPSTLNFGDVVVGETRNRSFTILNVGDHNFTSSVSESCPNFEILSGGGTFTLFPGDSRTVTARFSPTTVGSQNCYINTGATCGGVSCSGEGIESPPACDVNPTSLTFGMVEVGDWENRSFQITNTGGNILTGQPVIIGSSYFTIISGGGPYSLGAGQSAYVTIRYQPFVEGAHTCNVSVGTSCSMVACSGEAEDGPICHVEPTLVDFGEVKINPWTPTSGKTDTFVISNLGGGTLTGSVTMPAGCVSFSILSGGGSFSLGAGQFRVVTVRFRPQGGYGEYECTVDTGTDCDDVTLKGIAIPWSTFSGN